MADNKEQLAAGGVGFGLGALLLALTRGKPISAADNSALVALLQAIDEGLQQEQQTLQAILDALQNQGSGTAMAVPNRTRVNSTRIVITAPQVGVPIRLPHFFIPDGFALKLKAGFANVGQIYIAESSAASININQSEELNRGEFTLYKIKDAYEMWISGNTALDYLTITSEVP